MPFFDSCDGVSALFLDIFKIRITHPMIKAYFDLQLSKVINFRDLGRAVEYGLISFEAASGICPFKLIQFFVFLSVFYQEANLLSN